MLALLVLISAFVFSNCLRPTGDVSLFGGNLEKATAMTEKCGVAKMKCAYRVGCGAALREYMIECAEIMSGRSRNCKAQCKRALIALTSTDEGQALMDCDCEGLDYCEVSKQRVEVCRPDVSHAVAHGTVVSCSVAEWICTADHLCSTALDYYHRLCGALFEGRKCTLRCNNSIAILARQEKAAKLRSCQCDGKEEFPCTRIRNNTNRLCFGREKGGQIGGKVEEDATEISDQDTTEDSRKNDVGGEDKVKGNCSKVKPWTLLFFLVVWTIYT